MRPFPWLALTIGLAWVATGASAHEQEVEGGQDGGTTPAAEAHCDGGLAMDFPCWNVDLLAWLPTGTFGQGAGNDIWGWTDRKSGREIALMGLRGGTAFVDVSDPHRPVHLGTLPTQTLPSSWRDIKTYADHAFVVSEAAGHGLQIFDLTQLEHVRGAPAAFAPTTHYAGFGRAHNLALDEETGTAFALGTDTCAGGLHMIDVTRPLEPRFLGCFDADGYTHDAQCVVYRGPDAEHHGREICVSSNEDTVTIVDVTEKQAPRLISRTGYAGQVYTHQGWLTQDHAWFLLGDELDEQRKRHPTRTYIWDVSDLDRPFVAGTYTGDRNAIDHNLFIVGNHVFEANYRIGLRVLRIGDPSRAELVEVAFFDTFPFVDGRSFSGAWGVYPFFESGVVVVSDINRGLFVLAPDLLAVPECSDGIDNDRDGFADYPADPSCATGDGAAELPRSDAEIDIRPGSEPNPVNPDARGVVAVAVLGSDRLEVGRIDPASLRFGPDGAPARLPVRDRDVDADGRPDRVAHYALREAGLERGTASACLDWRTWDGTPYRACARMRQVPDAPHPDGRPR